MPESLPVLLIEYTLLLACLEPVCNLLYQHIQWIGYIAAPRGALQVAAVPYFSFAIL
jgi:hypothetical protein